MYMYVLILLLREKLAFGRGGGVIPRFVHPSPQAIVNQLSKKDFVVG